MFRRDAWHEERISKILTLNLNQKEHLGTLEKNNHTNSLEALPKSEAKPEVNQRPKFIPVSPPRRNALSPNQFRETLPKSPNSKVSLTVQRTQELLNSKRFFETTKGKTAGKTYKFGVAYQRHQNKLKKLLENDKDDINSKGTPQKITLKIDPTRSLNTSFSKSIQSPQGMSKPSSPNVNLRKALAMGIKQYHKEQLMHRRSNTEEVDRSSYASTPGLVISKFLSNNQPLNTEPSLKNSWVQTDGNGNIVTGKKSLRTLILAQDRGLSYDTEDSFRESSSSLSRLTPKKRNSFFEIKSAVNPSTSLHAPKSSFQNMKMNS